MRAILKDVECAEEHVLSFKGSIKGVSRGELEIKWYQVMNWNKACDI